jgi:DNA-binding MarR family transcriptional regulator
VAETTVESESHFADFAEFILRASRELRLQQSHTVNAVALTPSNSQVMRFIDTHPDTTPSEVAEATGLLRTNLSTALRELERIGFIERRSDPADGRGIRIRSTTLAASNLAVLRANWAEAVARIVGEAGGIGGVVEATALLERLTDGLAEERQRAGLRSGARQF